MVSKFRLTYTSYGKKGGLSYLFFSWLTLFSFERSTLRREGVQSSVALYPVPPILSWRYSVEEKCSLVKES
jgi:hypothetical protein